MGKLLGRAPNMKCDAREIKWLFRGRMLCFHVAEGMTAQFSVLPWSQTEGWFGFDPQALLRALLLLYRNLITVYTWLKTLILFSGWRMGTHVSLFYFSALSTNWRHLSWVCCLVQPAMPGMLDHVEPTQVYIGAAGACMCVQVVLSVLLSLNGVLISYFQLLVIKSMCTCLCYLCPHMPGSGI